MIFSYKSDLNMYTVHVL